MYDTIIIGSGPAGLSAAIYAGRAALDFILIEKNYCGTGQIAESARVDNYPGLYGESGFDLGERFRDHAKALGTEFYEAEVTGIIPDQGGYRVELSGGTAFLTKTVIYAAGASPRRLNIKGEAEFSGKGVSYCAVCDGAFYKGKDVAVIGGGDTAFGDALFLSKIAKSVYLIHRREEFRAGNALREQVLHTENIKPVLNAALEEIAGDRKVSSVKIHREGNTETLPVDGVFVAIGMIPNTGLLKGIAELSGDGYVIAGEDGITSAKGIFAAGDVREKALRQVVTAAADGANCIHSAEQYLAEHGTVTK